jgi:hypothetical protein
MGLSINAVSGGKFHSCLLIHGMMQILIAHCYYTQQKYYTSLQGCRFLFQKLLFLLGLAENARQWTLLSKKQILYYIFKVIIVEINACNLNFEKAH